MKIRDLFIGIFKCNSNKDAYLAAMKDIKEYRKSMISYRAVGLTSDTHQIIEESYVGGTKKLCKEKFHQSHPNCFTTYTRIYTENQAEDYFRRLNTLEVKIKTNKILNNEKLCGYRWC